MNIKDRFDLTNKVAIITGASKGIGMAMARGLAEFGAKVVVSSRSQEAVDTVASELQLAGFDAIGMACHVGKEADMNRLIEQTTAHYGAQDLGLCELRA